MADTTDRFSLDTYAQGDENWDHTDTVQFLDESAIEVDTIANRPTSGDYDDELFFARDQRILWRWDAGTTDWEAVSGLGVDGTPVPGTSHFEALEAANAIVAKIQNNGSDVTVTDNIKVDEESNFGVSFRIGFNVESNGGGGATLEGNDQSNQGNTELVGTDSDGNSTTLT